MTNVIAIKKPAARKTAAKAKPETSPTVIKRRFWQKRLGYAFGAIGFATTVLSLSHLAEGVTMVTHRAAWEGWTLATMIDCGFIACELIPYMAATPGVARDGTRIAKPFVILVLLASAAFNAIAFAKGAGATYDVVGAVLMGLAMPFSIYTATRLAGAFLLNGRG